MNLLLVIFFFFVFLFWVPVMFLGHFNSNFRTIFSIYFKNNVFGPVFMGL